MYRSHYFFFDTFLLRAVFKVAWTVIVYFILRNYKMDASLTRLSNFIGLLPRLLIMNGHFLWWPEFCFSQHLLHPLLALALFLTRNWRKPRKTTNLLKKLLINQGLMATCSSSLLCLVSWCTYLKHDYPKWSNKRRGLLISRRTLAGSLYYRQRKGTNWRGSFIATCSNYTLLNPNFPTVRKVKNSETLQLSLIIQYIITCSGVTGVDNWRGEYSYIRVHRP